MSTNTSINSSTYIQPNEVFSTTGFSAKKNFKHGNIGFYAGLGIDYNKGTDLKKYTGGVFDLTGGLNYGGLGDYGDWKANGSVRFRTVMFEDKKYLQIRLQPFNANYPINDKLNISFTPYVATKFDFIGHKNKTQAGAFAGIGYNFGKVKVTIEGQSYDITSFASKDFGGNIIVSIPLG